MITPKLPSSRANNYDFIRFVAATLVLYSHCFPLSGRNDEEPFFRLLRYESGGGIAVAVFFIISGYLISASYLNSKSSDDYSKKRIFRIFPGLIGAVVFTLILGAVMSPLPLYQYIRHPQTISYINNAFLFIQYNLPLVFTENVYPNTVNGSLWTLPVEFAMYFVVLVVGIIFGITRTTTITVAAVFFLLYVLIGKSSDAAGTIMLSAASLEAVLKLGTFFFLGASLYLHRGWIKPNGWLAGTFLLVIILANNYPIAKYLYVIFMPYIVVYLAQINTPRAHAFAKYGDFSYGIYIYAYPIQQLIIHQFGPSISIAWFFMLSFIPTVIFAGLSWHLIEKPALNFIRRPPRPAH